MFQNVMAATLLISVVYFMATGWLSIWGKPLNFQILSFLPWHSWMAGAIVVVLVVIGSRQRRG